MNLWVAAGLVGLVFGLLHLGNASVKDLPLSGEIGTVAIISIGGVLYALATADGAKQAEMKLDTAPVYDGLAIAGGRLYLSTVNGTLLCIGGR